MSITHIAHCVTIAATSWCGALLFVGLTTAAGHAQSPDPSVAAVSAFQNTTQDYVRMHRRLETEIGSITIGTPVDEINRMIRELASAIRDARTGARQGDFFTPAIASLLRARINTALLEHGYTADDVRAAWRVDAVNYTRVRLDVNGTFPWVFAAAMLPCVIEALPAVPPELQYRFVGDDLVLVDVHASLIVDYLPQALVDPTTRDPLPEVPEQGGR